MKKLTLFFLILEISSSSVLMAQTPTQQWLTVLNAENPGIDGFEVCNFADYWRQSKRLAVSFDGSKVGVTGISGCDIYNGIVGSSNGGTLFGNTFTSVGTDAGQAIASDVNNSFISTGCLNQAGQWTGLLTKINSGNALAFQNVISPTGSSLRTDIGSLRIDNSGNIYAQGAEYTGSQNLNTLRKFNSSGNLLWSSTIMDYDWFYGYPGRLTLDPSGNAIFTGKRQTSSNPGTYDVVIRKVNPGGTQLWEIYYDVGEDYIYDITTDTSGDIYIAVEIRGVGDRVVKLNGTSGSVIWSTQYSNIYKSSHIKVNTNGNILVNSSQGPLRAFSASTGALIWTSSTSSSTYGSFDTDNNSKTYTLSGNKIYITKVSG